MVIGILEVTFGAVLLVFGSPIARARISARRPKYDLSAVDGPTYRRTRRVLMVMRILYPAVGAFVLFGGVRTLIG
jgi:hypothetical protein